MAAQSGCSAPVVPSLPPPTPKSPPQYPDLYGKRRETARVQMLEREIGFLEIPFASNLRFNWTLNVFVRFSLTSLIPPFGFNQEELKSVERLQPASKFCKEIADFVTANPDPLIPTNRKKRRSCRFWKWLCGMPCFSLSSICCCCCCDGCSLEMPRCSCCSSCSGSGCGSCSGSGWGSCCSPFANRVSVALLYQSGSVAAHVPDPIAAKLIHVRAAKFAALSHHVRVHVRIALV
ncbi:hypothetical protein ACLB2K_008659 [Fragaria x ananassa]